MESKESDNKFQALSPGSPPHPAPAKGGTQEGGSPASADLSGTGSPSPKAEGGRKKRILRTIGLSVGSLFLIAIAVFGWWAYRQWTDMKEMVESVRRISSAVEANMGALAPVWQAGQVSKSSASLHLAMQTAGTGKFKLPVVPFSLGPGGLPRGVPEIVRNSQKMLKAFSKYKDRPLVKEFLNDLNSDSKFKKAWEERSTGNPIKFFSQVTNMKNLTIMIEKYAERPEFAILMIEVMNDPELKPLFAGMNPGITGGMAAGTGSPPSRSIRKRQSVPHPQTYQERAVPGRNGALPNAEGSRLSLESLGSRSPSPNAEGSRLSLESLGSRSPSPNAEGGPAFTGLSGTGASSRPAQHGMPFVRGSVKPDNMTEEADDFQTMTLDPSQIQGNKSTSSISVRPSVVPPP